MEKIKAVLLMFSLKMEGIVKPEWSSIIIIIIIIMSNLSDPLLLLLLLIH